VAAVTTPYEKLAVALHDLLEDSPMAADGLQDARCPPQVVTAVQALTRRPGEDFEVLVVRAVQNAIVPIPGRKQRPQVTLRLTSDVPIDSTEVMRYPGDRRRGNSCPRADSWR
jgi:hypothetical protein